MVQFFWSYVPLKGELHITFISEWFDKNIYSAYSYDCILDWHYWNHKNKGFQMVNVMYIYIEGVLQKKVKFKYVPYYLRDVKTCRSWMKRMFTSPLEYSTASPELNSSGAGSESGASYTYIWPNIFQSTSTILWFLPCA